MLVERLLRIALLGSSWVMYLLLFLSVFSIAAMIERVLFFRRQTGNEEVLCDELVRRLRRGDREGAEKLLEKTRGVEAQVIGRSMEWLDGGPEAFTAAVESQLGRKKKELERGMGFLGTLGSNAPFIGLFGTVIGVIEAFHQLGEGANKAAMGNVMSGIAEALVATGVGLFVAIPAVVAYNVVQKKIGAIESNVATICKAVCAVLLMQRSGAGAADKAAGPANGKRAESTPGLATATVAAEAE